MLIWKYIKTRFWSFVWFFLLPCVISVLIEITLVKSSVFIEMAPWRILLGLAIVSFIFLSLKRYLPFWEDEELSFILKRKKAKKLAYEIKAKLTKYLKKIEKKENESLSLKVKRVVDELDEAIKQGSYKKISEIVDRIQRSDEFSKLFPKENSAFELIRILGIAIIFAILFRTFIVEPFKIPSASMIPTLQIGDHIFVEKFAYGIKVPGLFKKSTTLFWRVPSRSDVIVFKPPPEPEKDFIKRVVGLPGDILEIKDSVLYINGKAVPRCRVGWVDYEDRDQSSGGWEKRRGILYVEKLGGKHYLVMRSAYSSDWGPEKVGEGMVYVMGDNRDNSFDSRVWGGVPFGNIKGEGMIIWWSNGPNATLRINRMGHKIEGDPIVNGTLKLKVHRCIEKMKSVSWELNF